MAAAKDAKSQPTKKAPKPPELQGAFFGHQPYMDMLLSGVKKSHIINNWSGKTGFFAVCETSTGNPTQPVKKGFRCCIGIVEFIGTSQISSKLLFSKDNILLHQVQENTPMAAILQKYNNPHAMSVTRVYRLKQYVYIPSIRGQRGSWFTLPPKFHADIIAQLPADAPLFYNPFTPPKEEEEDDDDNVQDGNVEDMALFNELPTPEYLACMKEHLNDYQEQLRLERQERLEAEERVALYMERIKKLEHFIARATDKDVLNNFYKHKWESAIQLRQCPVCGERGNQEEFIAHLSGDKHLDAVMKNQPADDKDDAQIVIKESKADSEEPPKPAASSSALSSVSVTTEQSPTEKQSLPPTSSSSLTPSSPTSAT